MGEIFTGLPLFAGLSGQEIASLLPCLAARESAYVKGEAVLRAGEAATRVGVVLAGAVRVVRDDVLGNRTILARLGEGEMFAETFACAGVPVLPVSVEATSACRVLLLDYRKIITTCTAACAFHSRLVANMLQILAGKNLQLNHKIEALSARGLRQKLMTYLLGQATAAGGKRFQIPFNRQELADYLAADRSAVSRELAAMQREGLLHYEKDWFSV